MGCCDVDLRIEVSTRVILHGILVSNRRLWHRIKRMNRSTAIRILVAGMLVVFVLPLLALSLFAAPTEVGGSCNGHHKPMPTPSNNCCYARPQPPAQVRVVPSATPLKVVNGFVAPHDIKRSDVVLDAQGHEDLSLPPQLILRI
jgi:hypothetical protein